MATTKLGNTKSASKSINYAEKRAREKSGLNLDIEYAKSQMKMTRSMFGKEDGIQAHTIIQSFKPNEVTAEQANEIGRELAEKVAPNHQVAIYTHDDKEHMHNHIVIGAINLETGRKYQSNAKQRHHVKEKNDEICRNHELSVVTEFTNPVRYTLSESELLEKKQRSWKDEIRRAIENSRDNSTNFDTFRQNLQETYGIETKLRGKTLSFKHPDRERFVRANKLGYDYEKGALEHEFTRQTQRATPEQWREFEQTVAESRPRTETKEHAVSERLADGENEADERSHGKDTGDIEYTPYRPGEESSKTSTKQRKSAKERDGGMEL